MTALVFDGAATRIARTPALRSIDDNRKGTFSAWFEVEDGSDGTDRSILSIGASAELLIELNSLNTLQITGENSSGTEILNLSATSALNAASGTWHHLLASWNLDASTPVAHIYLDGTAQTVTTKTAGELDLGGLGATIGRAHGVPGGFWDGGLYEVVYWHGIFVDISTVANRSLFASSDGQSESQSDQYRQNAGPNSGIKPVGIGADGSIPSGGTRPLIWFGGAWLDNKGTGGGFTPSGTFDEMRGPKAYRSSALRPTPGERWFESEQSGWSYPRSETITEDREGLTSAGLRIGIDEVDDTTRNERPSQTFSQLIIGSVGREDDSEDDR